MKYVKEAAKVLDRLFVSGGTKTGERGIMMHDGTAVPIELIQKIFSVSREEAEKISRRPRK